MVEGKHHLAISPGGAQATRIMKIIFVLFACLLPSIASAQSPVEPPNAPAAVDLTAGRVVLTYQGRVLFEGTVETNGSPVSLIQVVDTIGGRVTQVLKWTASGRRPHHAGRRRARSPEAFAAESEPREDGLRVVRHAVGPVLNRLNRAVYDRRGDWVLSVDEPAGFAMVVPATTESGVGRLSVERGRRGGVAAVPAAILPAASRSGGVPAVGISAVEQVGRWLDVLVRLLRQGDGAGHPPDRGCAGRGTPAVRLQLPADRRRLSAAPHRDARPLAPRQRKIPGRAGQP